MELATIVVAVASANVLNNLINTAASTNKIDACVDAYYADKFNGDKFGSPTKTFLKCMQTNYPETFKEAKKRYDSPPASSTVEQR